MRFIKALIILAIFIFGLLFFTQNQDILSTPLELQYNLFIEGWSWAGLNVPFYFVFLVAFGTGALLTLIFFFLDRLRSSASLFSSRRTVRMLEREIKRLQSECDALNKPKILPAGSAFGIEEELAASEAK